MLSFSWVAPPVPGGATTSRLAALGPGRVWVMQVEGERWIGGSEVVAVTGAVEI